MTDVAKMRRGAPWSLERLNMKLRNTLPTLLLLSACGGEDLDVRQPVRDEPTASLIPFLCRVTAPLPIVGRSNPVGTVIQSLGRDDLVISDVRLRADLRDSFSLQGAEGPEGETCSTEMPCTIPFPDDVAVSLFLEPQSRGWDYVELEVVTNLPGQEVLSIPVVAFSKDPEEPDTVEKTSRPDEARCLCVTQEEFTANGCGS